jgi:transposase
MAWRLVPSSTNDFRIVCRCNAANVRHQNLVLLNAILYVAEHGCKWRGLPKRYGNWHSIYVRMNRWAKKGVLDQVFAKLQQEQILRIKIEAFSLDSTSVKAHSDGSEALNKRTASHREIARGMEHKDSSGCRECSNGNNLLLVARRSARRSGGPATAAGVRSAAGRSSVGHGPGLRKRRNSAIGAEVEHDSGGSTQIEPARTPGLRSRTLQETQAGRAMI